MIFSSKYSEALNKITKNCFKNKKAFVIYKKPKEQHMQLIVSSNYKSVQLSDIQDESFIFMPFDSNKKGYCISRKENYCDEQIIAYSQQMREVEAYPFNAHSEFFQTGEEEFINHIDAIKKNIATQSFSKIVASRVYSKRYKGNIASAFLSLCDVYDHSLNYLIYIPNEHCWIGATPEVLLNLRNNQLHTISLAGTQLRNDSHVYSWAAKERNEQKIVTEFIQAALEDELQTAIKVSEPYSIEAANLVHLRSDISCTFPEHADIKNVIAKLHPTPAVSGMPKAASQNYILRNEKHDRLFYTGYLGEYIDKQHADLFVNLRCAAIDNNFIHFFVGCGITADSVAEKEWIETENKINTLKKAIKL